MKGLHLYVSGGRICESVWLVHTSLMVGTLIETCKPCTQPLLQSTRNRNKKNESFIVDGDFNADVGSCSEYDNSKVVGMCGLGQENQRGQWLKQWCDLENLIGNTFYPKSHDRRVTYVGPNLRERQIDFIFLDQYLRRYLRDSSSTTELDLGSHHRGVHARFMWPIRTEKRLCNMHRR